MHFSGANLLLFVLLNWLIALAEAQSDKSLNVSIILDPLIHDILCVNETVLLTCQVLNATQPIYSWTSSGSAVKISISSHNKSLEVNATNDYIQYHCHVFDVTTNSTGEDSTIIFSNNLPPTLQKTNFDEVVEVTEGSSINLTVQVFSSLPLNSEPVWLKMNGILSSGNVINHINISDAITFTSLELYNVSHTDDTGIYSLIASNRCGSSSFIVYISVKDPRYKVCPVVPELLNASVASGAIDGDTSSFQCGFEADYTYFISYWTIMVSNQQFITVTVNETNPLTNFSVRVYQDCLLTIECCEVISELTITNTPISLDSATVTCYAALPSPNDLIISSDIVLTVFVRPTLIMEPLNVTIEQNTIAHFECYFNASMQEYLAIVEWLKNDSDIINISSGKYVITTRIEPEQTNVIFTELNITNISSSDEGFYHCKCYYNTTILNRFHIDTPVIAEGIAALQLKVQGEQEQSSQGSIAIIIGVTTVIITMFNVILCSFCCLVGFQYCSANREIRLRNANIIGNINTNMSLRDENSSVTSSEHTSNSINQLQETTNDNSVETNGENYFDVEPPEVYFFPYIDSKIETEQPSHNPTAYADNLVDKESLSQSPAVSIINCSSRDDVSQNAFLDENAKPLANREVLSSVIIELQPIENNMFNTKDLEPQNVHTHPIPIANVHEIESEEQFHTPDSKSTQVHMDNLLCVETLSQSPHDILQSKSSGENAVSFYDRETSSDMHNEFQAIDSGENSLLNTKDFEPQNVHTNPIPIANVHKIESEEQFHTPDSKTMQENLDHLDTLLHSPHEIVQIESSVQLAALQSTEDTKPEIISEQAVPVSSDLVSNTTTGKCPNLGEQNKESMQWTVERAQMITYPKLYDVEINYAPSPLDTEYLVGDIEAKMFDERGGVFHSYKHGVTVIVPPEAIPSGILAELKFAATVVASVKFTDVTPVSAIYWLCMDVTLKKPIQVRLPQKFVENDASTLQFAKSLHSSTKVIEPIMGVIDGGKFNALENHAHIEVNHFCYYCIVRKLDPSKIPRNKYLVVAMKCYEKEKIWRVDICVLPLIKTCLESLKSQYSDDWKDEVLVYFSFEDNCTELEIKLSTNDFETEAVIEFLLDQKIKQEDIDFHQYYSEDRLEELKFKMDQNLYPPRCKARVKAKHESFFKSSKAIDYQLTNDKKCITGKIIIPSNKDLTSSDTESDSSVKQTSSGYGPSINGNNEPVQGENKGELQLKTLIIRTKSVVNKWIELGMALGVPIEKLERINEKHRDNPFNGLVRVYRYWLADKNSLMPTWRKLINALYEIDEYSLAASVVHALPLDDLHPPLLNDASDKLSQFTKKLVMEHVQPHLLDFCTLVPVLNKYHLLTQTDNYILINPLIPPLERANALLYMMLPSKGPGAYETFIKCLQEEQEHSGHQGIAAKLVIPEDLKKKE